MLLKKIHEYTILPLRKIKEWSLKKIRGEHAVRWLAGFSFAESSFFPIPPDIFLVAISGAKKGEGWRYLAFITTISSVFGGIFGYMIGIFFFDTIGIKLISFYGLETEMQKVSDIFSQYAFWAVFVAGFTPIPYKLFALSAGLFHINFLVFVLASVISRGLRFFVVSYIAGVLGKRMQSETFARFQKVTAYTAVIFVFIFLIFLFFKR